MKIKTKHKHTEKLLQFYTHVVANLDEPCFIAVFKHEAEETKAWAW